MLEMLFCYGFAANMIRAGYLDLVSDLFRQIWSACHRFGAARRPGPESLRTVAWSAFGPAAKRRRCVWRASKSPSSQ